MTRPDPSDEQGAAAHELADALVRFDDRGHTPIERMTIADDVDRIARAFAEREAGLRAEVERLTRERDEAHGWLRKVDGQPFPDSVAHCAAFALGSWKGATARAESAESELALLRPVVEAAKAWKHEYTRDPMGGEQEWRDAQSELRDALARAESAEKGGANV